LELVLVMAIIAIMLGLAIPRLSAFARGHRTSDCIDNIVALTRWARTQAITRGLTYRLHVDPANRTYWLTYMRDDGMEVNLSEGDWGKVYTAPEGVRIDWDAPQQPDGKYIQFQPSGRTDPARIVVTGQDNKSTDIACFSATEMYHIVTDEERQQGLENGI